jgi:DNA modification methylase
MNIDLFGNEIITKLSIKDRFIVPPFSILDGNSGDWTERLRRWKKLNIKSEIGRNENILFNQGLEKYMPNYNNTSIFDPVLCELMYRWFCPDSGLIIDPFAGGSVRGIVANYLGYKYTGIELRQEQVNSNREQGLNILEVNNQPQWYIGDSEQILNDLIPTYDFAFTCPPYFNLEVYSDLEQDLSTMDYDTFICKYERILINTIAKLKPKSYFIIVVGEVRDKQGYYIDFVGDTKKIFMRNGMKYYNDFVYKERGLLSAGFRVNNNFVKSKKNVKIHQNVICFFKL